MTKGRNSLEALRTAATSEQRPTSNLQRSKPEGDRRESPLTAKGPLGTLNAKRAGFSDSGFERWMLNVAPKRSAKRRHRPILLLAPVQITPLTASPVFPQVHTVNRPESLDSSTRFPVLLGIATIVLTILGVAHAAAPYTSATVTRLQNKVAYGERRGGKSVTRPAAVQDIVRETNFLLTESDARAEIQYEDGSLVRVGQNTVFSFDSDSRTLELERGTFIFHVPKGSGGGTIKTPSLTAAITGTTGKVSRNIIAVLEGEIRLIPSGRPVKAGQFARRNADQSITIAEFDAGFVDDGKLMNFNGPMPGGFDGGFAFEVPGFGLSPTNLSGFESLERANNLPSSIEQFFPQVKPPGPEPEIDRPRPTVRAPRPQNQAPSIPSRGGTY